MNLEEFGLPHSLYGGFLELQENELYVLDEKDLRFEACFILYALQQSVKPLVSLYEKQIKETVNAKDQFILIL